MRMHALSSGSLRMRKRVFLPDADKAETIDLPVAAYLFRHPQGNVLFDSGCHPSVADDAEGRWGALAGAMVPDIAPGEDVISQLALVGLGPEDIDVVVNSHLHCDHCGCNGFFTKATFFVHADELATARDPAQEGQGYFRADWEHPMPVEPVTDQRDLFGDDRLVLLPLPGHSPGLTTLLASLDRSGTFLLASDAVALRENLDTGVMPRTTWNLDLMDGSMAEIRRIEKGGATVVCGHDAAQWATMRKGGAAYD